MLCDSARAFRLIEREVNNFDIELKTHIDLFEANLKKKHNVKVLISDWLVKEFVSERQRFADANVNVNLMRTLEKLKEENLYQAAYFVERELVFLKEV